MIPDTAASNAPDRSRYSQFMAGVELLQGEGWDDQPTFREMCVEYIGSELGTITDTQFERAFSYAWVLGHSSGYSEVASIFDDVVQILKEFTSEEVTPRD